jgi:hypothetical protein
MAFVLQKAYFCHPKIRNTALNADMAKLADAPDLGSGAARHVGSTPIIRTSGVDWLIS